MHFSINPSYQPYSNYVHIKNGNESSLFQVAWLKSDSKAILAIHTRMVALNQRLSVTHNGHNTWKLHIAHVQLNDSGSYMCQVNTNPMRSQVSLFTMRIIHPQSFTVQNG